MGHAKNSSKSLAILGAVLALSLPLAACDDKGGEGNAAAQQQAPATEVAVVTIEPQDITLKTELPGRTSAYQVAEIRPQVSGIILERLFEEGSDVTEGQQLYQIDPAVYKANYDQAVAQLKRAEATLKSVRSRSARYKELVAVNAISKQEYDDIVSDAEAGEADVAMAKAAVETARINLAYTKVFAPISGRIGKSAVTAGALVTADQTTPLALVQQLDPIYVDVTQSSAQLLQLKQQVAEGRIAMTGDDVMQVELVLDATGQTYPHKGKLKFSDVTVDEATGSVNIRALFPNPDNMLLPGLFVRALIQQGVQAGALLVPQQAVMRSAGGRTTVYAVTPDNTIEAREIRTGDAISDKWVVLQGVQAGDRLVVQGLQKVGPGAPVRVITMEEALAAAEDKASTQANPSGAAPAAGTQPQQPLSSPEDSGSGDDFTPLSLEGQDAGGALPVPENSETENLGVLPGANETVGQPGETYDPSRAEPVQAPDDEAEDGGDEEDPAR